MMPATGRSLRTLAVAVAVAAAVWPWQAHAQCPATLHTTCATICDPGSTGSLCLVQSCKRIAPDSVIDCGNQDLSIETDNARLWVENGTFTLKANDVTIGPAGTVMPQATRIEATREAGSRVPFGMVIQLTGTLEMRGYLQANSAKGGGTITVEAAGNVTILDSSGNQGIQADALTSGHSGGVVHVRSGGDVVIGDEIFADGSTFATSNGGRITIEAVGNIDVSDRIRAKGHGVNDETGQGGTVSLRAAGNVTVLGIIEAEGGGAYGDGGEIHLKGEQLTLHRVATGSNHDLSTHGGVGAQGGRAQGGLVRLIAGASGIDIMPSVFVDTRGGEGGAGQDDGAFIAESDGDITVGSAVQVLARSDLNGGDGGNIVLRAAGTLVVDTGATLDARGSSASGGEGSGARIELSACTLSVATGATLDASGFEGGEITVTGRDTLSVDGSFDASGSTPDDDGEITLSYRAQGWCNNAPTTECAADVDCVIGCMAGVCVLNPTIGPGATFNPGPPVAPDDFHDPQLAGCD